MSDKLSYILSVAYDSLQPRQSSRLASSAMQKEEMHWGTVKLKAKSTTYKTTHVYQALDNEGNREVIAKTRQRKMACQYFIHIGINMHKKL